MLKKEQVTPFHLRSDTQEDPDQVKATVQPGNSVPQYSKPTSGASGAPKKPKDVVKILPGSPLQGTGAAQGLAYSGTTPGQTYPISSPGVPFGLVPKFAIIFKYNHNHDPKTGEFTSGDADYTAEVHDGNRQELLSTLTQQRFDQLAKVTDSDLRVKLEEAYALMHMAIANAASDITSNDKVLVVMSGDKIGAAASYTPVDNSGMLHINAIGAVVTGDGGKLLDKLEALALEKPDMGLTNEGIVTVDSTFESFRFFKEHGYEEDKPFARDVPGTGPLIRMYKDTALFTQGRPPRVVPPIVVPPIVVPPRVVPPIVVAPRVVPPTVVPPRVVPPRVVPPIVVPELSHPRVTRSKADLSGIGVLASSPKWMKRLERAKKMDFTSILKADRLRNETGHFEPGGNHADPERFAKMTPEQQKVRNDKAKNLETQHAKNHVLEAGGKHNTKDNSVTHQAGYQNDLADIGRNVHDAMTVNGFAARGGSDMGKGDMNEKVMGTRSGSYEHDDGTVARVHMNNNKENGSGVRVTFDSSKPAGAMKPARKVDPMANTSTEVPNNGGTKEMNPTNLAFAGGFGPVDQGGVARIPRNSKNPPNDLDHQPQTYATKSCWFNDMFFASKEQISGADLYVAGRLNPEQKQKRKPASSKL